MATQPLPQSTDLIGTTVGGGWTLQEILGQGGMGVVYLAWHARLRKKAAVKTVLPSLVHYPALLERFEKEARAASEVHHPNVVSIFDLGSLEDGRPWMLMPYLDGVTVDGHLRAIRLATGRPGLSASDVLWIMAPVCAAIRTAHGHRILHRDLKLENVFLARNDDGVGSTVIVMDFGLAHKDEGMGQTSLGAGTAGAMSPEQARGEPVTSAADIYSLGVMLFELFTGRKPFEARNPADLVAMQLNTAAPDPRQFAPDVPAGVVEVILACLRPHPDARPQSVDELLRLLVAGTPGGRAIVAQVASPLLPVIDRAGPTERTIVPIASSTSSDAASTSRLLGWALGTGGAAARPARWPLLLAGIGVTSLAAAIALTASEGSPTRAAASAPQVPATLSRAASAPEPVTPPVAPLTGTATTAPADTHDDRPRSPPDNPAVAATIDTTDAGVIDAQAAAAAQPAASGAGAEAARVAHRPRRRGTLSFEVEPWPGADIYRVEGKREVFQGSTPLTLELPAGSYTFKLTSEKLGKSIQKRARVEPDRVHRIEHRW